MTATAISSSNASGVQRKVYNLYRKILREAMRKDREKHLIEGNPSPAASALLRPVANNTTTTWYARQEFRRQAASVRRSDFTRIEYMIRKGEKQWKLLRMPGVVTVVGQSSQKHQP
jgi:hypothetical protein